MMKNNKLLTVRMPESLRQEFLEKAENEGTSGRQLILGWINQYLGNEEKQDGGDDRLKKLEDRIAAIETQLQTSQPDSQNMQDSQPDSPTEIGLEATETTDKDKSPLSHSESLIKAYSLSSHDSSQLDSLETSHDDSLETSQPDSQPDSLETSKEDSAIETSHDDSLETSQPDSQPDSLETSQPDSKEDSQPDSLIEPQEPQYETLSQNKLADRYDLSPSSLKKLREGFPISGDVTRSKIKKLGVDGWRWSRERKRWERKVKKCR